MQTPPKNTLWRYQVDNSGRPNDKMAARRNKASNAANPLKRLEKDAPLLRPPLKSVFLINIDIFSFSSYKKILNLIRNYSLVLLRTTYVEPLAVLVRTITDIVFPMNPKVEMNVKITPSIINLKNVPSSICASTFGNNAENIYFLF